MGSRCAWVYLFEYLCVCVHFVDPRVIWGARGVRWGWEGCVWTEGTCIIYVAPRGRGYGCKSRNEPYRHMIRELRLGGPK